MDHKHQADGQVGAAVEHAENLDEDEQNLYTQMPAVLNVELFVLETFGLESTGESDVEQADAVEFVVEEQGEDHEGYAHAGLFLFGVAVFGQVSPIGKDVGAVSEEKDGA